MSHETVTMTQHENNAFLIAMGCKIECYGAQPKIMVHVPVWHAPGGFLEKPLDEALELCRTRARFILDKLQTELSNADLQMQAMVWLYENNREPWWDMVGAECTR